MHEAVWKFTAVDSLKQGAYLKLSKKSKYIESWTEVDEKQVPEDTLLHLT
ncbi:YxeA family protein [Kurthia massiliensis]